MEQQQQQHNTTSLWDSLAPTVEVMAPGMVYLPQALSQEQQVWLARYALQAGNDPTHGFWVSVPGTSSSVSGGPLEKEEKEEKEKVEVVGGVRKLNSSVGRGRIYDAIETFPEHGAVEALCHRAVSVARSHDDKMPEMNPTHLLLLWYATTEGMCWHSDNDKNDGDNNHPIVSITIGNTCDFGYKLVGKKESTMQLRSGDILIWGGPNRMLPHCVEGVHAHTSPSFLHHLTPLNTPLNTTPSTTTTSEPPKPKPEDSLANVRLNFTYRDAPNIRGSENLFRYNVDQDYTDVLQHLLATAGPGSS
eukprot:TRINITY_DN3447_c0_g1_i1.p1 TRINITY_DN3447_c0_g1~~TRINITY_DN3447_c0_g1_i1.p1  ORF type:complete len:312 (+),score=76.95 TRINITY_DN3447_c0_g1_i1:25-936(+)